MRALALLMLVTSLGACRPDPGVPDYSGLTGLFGDGGAPELKPGPFPYRTGSRRLAFGAFYEGAASDRLPLDHYYIFSNSYATQPSDERVEGLQSDELDFKGTGFWGGGLFWDAPTNLPPRGTLEKMTPMMMHVHCRRCAEGRTGRGRRSTVLQTHSLQIEARAGQRRG